MSRSDPRNKNCPGKNTELVVQPNHPLPKHWVKERAKKYIDMCIINCFLCQEVVISFLT